MCRYFVDLDEKLRTLPNKIGGVSLYSAQSSFGLIIESANFVVGFISLQSFRRSRFQRKTFVVFAARTDNVPCTLRRDENRKLNIYQDRALTVYVLRITSWVTGDVSVINTVLSANVPPRSSRPANYSASRRATETGRRNLFGK